MEFPTPNYIRTKNKYVDIFGNISEPTFTKPLKYGATYTDNTNSIDVSYVQSNWSLIPKLAFGFYPFSGSLFFEAYTAYFIPVYEIGHIELSQNNGQDDTKLLCSEKLNAANLSVNFNNTKSSTNSYKFSGFQFGINIGFTFEMEHHNKVKTDVYGNKIKWYNRP